MIDLLYPVDGNIRKLNRYSDIIPCKGKKKKDNDSLRE